MLFLRITLFIFRLCLIIAKCLNNAIQKAEYFPLCCSVYQPKMLRLYEVE